jgi:hypothetical protein
LEQGQQTPGKQKVRQVVEGKGHLDAVSALLVFAEPSPNVIDQHIELAVIAQIS